MINNRRTLHIIFDPWWGEAIRSYAQRQGVTYKSLASACVQLGLQCGGPVVLEPFGEPDKIEGK